MPNGSLWESTHGNCSLCNFYGLACLTSGLQQSDLCPDDWQQVVLAASQGQFGCTSHEELFRVWRRWQLGSSTWINPACNGIPTRELAMSQERVQAGRSMVQWIPMGAKSPG